MISKGLAAYLPFTASCPLFLSSSLFSFTSLYSSSIFHLIRFVAEKDGMENRSPKNKEKRAHGWSETGSLGPTV